MQWAYGVTTVPERFGSHLPRTLASLRTAGFPEPRLFIDGCEEHEIPEEFCGLGATCHNPPLRTFGNWMLGLWELYIRQPNADRYAIFQDDVIACRNLRRYLEESPCPEKGYLNLCTWPGNEPACRQEGWHPARLRGWGAQGLVFDRQTVVALLSSKLMAMKPQEKGWQSWKNLDGRIAEALLAVGVREYIHNPSLLRHIGLDSSIGNTWTERDESTLWKGEDFDSVTLLGGTRETATTAVALPLRTVASTLFALPSPSFTRQPAPTYTGSSGRGIVLAVPSMQRFMTDENWQLTAGLERAGYTAAGQKQTIDETNVKQILDRASPGIVVLHDKREWSTRREGNIAMRACIRNVQELAKQPDVFRVGVLKDAQQEHQQNLSCAIEAGLHAWIVYYHPEIICRLSPFVRREHLVRTWHSVDAAAVPAFSVEGRSGCLLSGAVSMCYPLRLRLARGVSELPDTHLLRHPGYHHGGWATPGFLCTLSKYKVAICTASRYGYALRKIVEATACGCVVITDLPSDEVMPEIDGNLVRVSSDSSVAEVGEVVRELTARYDAERQREYGERAKAWYNWRVMGERLAASIERMRTEWGKSDDVRMRTRAPCGISDNGQDAEESRR